MLGHRQRFRLNRFHVFNIFNLQLVAPMLRLKHKCKFSANIEPQVPYIARNSTLLTNPYFFFTVSTSTAAFLEKLRAFSISNATAPMSSDSMMPASTARLNYTCICMRGSRSDVKEHLSRETSGSVRPSSERARADSRRSA